jgi:hypothetical protein
MNRCVVLFFFVVAPLAQAQQLPPLQVLLERLSDYSVKYAATLPSLSCSESIVSQRVKDGKVKNTVRITGTMREIRTEDPDDPFREQHEFTAINGKPIKKGTELHMPYFVTGAFANMVGFRRRDLNDCFAYTLSWAEDGKNVQLVTVVKPFPPETASHEPISICSDKVWQGTRSIVVADPETGQILHSERTVTPENAKAHNEAYFAQLDYVSQKIGDQFFLLPSEFYSHDAEDKGRMYATYSDCHRFGSEVRILPNATEVKTGPKQGLHPNTSPAVKPDAEPD